MQKEMRRASQGTLGVFFLVAACQGARVLSAKADALCNSAGSFGVPWAAWFLVGLTCGALIFFGVQWWQATGFREAWPWILILAGGVSNLSERQRFGCVSDYLTFPLVPLFNMADVLISIGVLGVLYQTRQRSRK